MRRINKTSIDDGYCISRYLYQRFSNNLFGFIAQLVEVTNSAVLGGVAEVVCIYMCVCVDLDQTPTMRRLI